MRLKLPMNNQHGFIGLTELMVIVAIVAILAGVGAPGFQAMRRIAREGVAIHDMGNIIRPAVEQFRLDLGEFPESQYSLLTNTYLVSDPLYAKWKGPYLRSDYVRPPDPDTNPLLEDPFGQPYVIYRGGSTSCVIVSTGRDTVQNFTDLTATINAGDLGRSTGKFKGYPVATDDLAVVVAGFD